MASIFYITSKDLIQMLRDRKSFLFLLIMPIAFTLLFGFAFSGSSQNSKDSRLPVGLLNQDASSTLSLEVERLLAPSEVIRLEKREEMAGLEKEVAENKLSAAHDIFLIVRQGATQRDLTLMRRQLQRFLKNDLTLTVNREI